MYSGDTCQESVFQPSCQEYKDLGLNEDSYCVIDPDGDKAKIKPFRVLCNMTQYQKKAVTILKSLNTHDVLTTILSPATTS